MTDPRLTRWIHASVREFVENRKRERLSTIHIYYESDIRQTNKYKENLELRIDGPYENHVGTASDYKADVEINMLINTAYHESQLFRHQDNMGLAAYLLHETIPIYKIGDNADDKSLIGALSRHDLVPTSNFGQIDPNVQVQQGTVEAHYTYEEC